MPKSKIEKIDIKNWEGIPNKGYSMYVAFKIFADKLNEIIEHINSCKCK